MATTELVRESESLCIEFGLKDSIDMMDLARIRHFLPELVIHVEDARAVLHFPVPGEGHRDRVERLVQVHSALDMIGLRPGIDYWIEGLGLTDQATPTVTLTS
ncbi:MAG: hypothetical protein WD206_07235 [Actinomycetota bacterium]